MVVICDSNLCLFFIASEFIVKKKRKRKEKKIRTKKEKEKEISSIALT